MRADGGFDRAFICRLSLGVMCGLGLWPQWWLLLEKQGFKKTQKMLVILGPQAQQGLTATSSTTDHNGESTKSTRHWGFSFEPYVTLLAKRGLMLQIVQKIVLGLRLFKNASLANTHSRALRK